MLKNIPSNVSGDMIKVLMEMGHGDEIVIADANFPRLAFPESGIVINAIGHNIPEILDSVLSLIPLDSYVENPTVFMKVAQGDKNVPNGVPDCWDDYYTIGKKYEKLGLREIQLDKPELYERTKKAYAVIITSEKALYANIILRKGVL